MATKAKHSPKAHFNYESVASPWFGGSAKAIAALRQVEITPLAEKNYIEYIESNYPTIYKNIEWIKFHKFKQRSSKYPSGEFEIRLAVTNLAPKDGARTCLYEVREEVAKTTGWYPLVQGSRAWAYYPPYLKYKSMISSGLNFTKTDLAIGKFICLRDLSSESGRSCFLLEGSRGKLLLDTGFHVPSSLLVDIKAICLSHLHQDHSGGIGDIIRSSKIPILLSDTSLTFPWGLDHFGLEEKARLTRQSIVLDHHGRLSIRRY